MKELTSKEIINALESAKKTNDVLTAIIEQLEPDAEFGKLAKQDETTFSMKEAADLLEKKTGLGRNKLMEWLRYEGVLLSSENYKNQPARTYIDRGYFSKAEKETPVGMKMVTVVTNKGIDFILKLWEKHRAEIEA